MLMAFSRKTSQAASEGSRQRKRRISESLGERKQGQLQAK